jgi:hypothetical protein
MLDFDILHQLQGTSVEERIRLIEAILPTLKRDLSAQSQLSVSDDRPLRDKLRHYNSPYEPIAAED